MTDLVYEWTTLGAIAKWGSGGTPNAKNPANYGGSIPWAVIGDLNDGFVSRTEKHLSDKGLENSSAKIVPPGAVLIAMYGSIGKLGINTIPMATNQAIAYAVPDESKILRDYLFWYLRSQRELLLNAGKGATQQNISQTILKAWKIALPSLDEQRRISEHTQDAFSQIDAMSEVVEMSLSKLRILKRTVLHQAFFGGADSA